MNAAASNLYRAIICPSCANALDFDDKGRRICCDHTGGSYLSEGIVRYDPSLIDRSTPEMIRRDQQAGNYLLHRKLPTQTRRLKLFLAQLTTADDAPVLDLGCGPGPTTKLLLDTGMHTVAIDFSIKSLEINARLCEAHRKRAVFIQADLKQIAFSDSAASGLMMADFLQHLGSEADRRNFLHKAFKALKPGGWFFISFFNFNLKHRLKGDRHGAFAEGAIKYSRLKPQEVLRMLPPDIAAAAIQPMNLFSDGFIDQFASMIPFAHFLSRYIVISGYKTGQCAESTATQADSGP